MADPYNICLLFFLGQLTLTLKTSHLSNPKPTLEVTMDLFVLTWDIKNVLPSNPLVTKLLSLPPTKLRPPWNRDKSSQLLYQGCLYMLDTSNLCLQVLHTFYDHILAGHLCQTKTQQLI